MSYEDEERIVSCPRCRKFIKIYLDYNTSCPYCETVLSIEKPVERVLHEGLKEYIVKNVRITSEYDNERIRKGLTYERGVSALTHRFVAHLYS